MKNRYWKYVVSLAVLLVMMCVSFSEAAPKYKWKFAVGYPRPTWYAAHKEFCELVKKYSDGEIEVTYYPDGQIGTHDEIVKGAQDGSIQIIMMSPYANLVPGGMMNWMPWTVTTWKEAKMAFENGKGILWSIMTDAYDEIGLHLLGQAPQGAYTIVNTVRPLKTPDDFKNMRFRVSASLGYVKAMENMSKGTGLVLQTMPWGEVYNALGKGVIESCWSPWSSLIDERIGEVIKHVSDINLGWDNNSMVMSSEVWKELPSNLKDAVKKAAMETEAKIYEEQQALELQFRKKVEALPGVTVTYLSPEERDAFRNKSDMDSIWKEICGPWLEKRYPGQNMLEKVRQELDKIHEAAK